MDATPVVDDQTLDLPHPQNALTVHETFDADDPPENHNVASLMIRACQRVSTIWSPANKI